MNPLDVQYSTMSLNNPQVAARVQLRKGCRGRIVADELRHDGMDSADAARVVKRQLELLRWKATALLGAGVLLVILGIAASMHSYVKATSSGFGFQVYYVFWSPVVFGTILAMAGLRRLHRHYW